MHVAESCPTFSTTSVPKSFPAALSTFHPCVDTGDCPSFAHGLVELPQVCTGTLLKPAQVLLDGIPSLCYINCTTYLDVNCKLAEGALSMLLMRILNNGGTSAEPWETPLITAFHLDTEKLTVTLWMQTSSLINLTVHPSDPYFCNLEVKVLWGTEVDFCLLTELKVEDIGSSSLLPTQSQ